MINIPSNTPDFKKITPDRALQYLQNKPIYLAIRKQIIPHFFEAKTFCDIINTIRIKRIEEEQKIDQQIDKLKSEEGEEKKINTLTKRKKTLFVDILNDVFTTEIIPVIKNSDITYKEVKQLIGSLSNITKTKKEEIQEIIENVNEEIQKNLDMEIYEEEILMTMDDLIYGFMKDTGGSINEGEKKGFGQQALKLFIKTHKKEIETGKIDIKKLVNHLHKKKIL